MVLSGEPAASRATLQRPAICVATGMIYFANPSLQSKSNPVYKRLQLYNLCFLIFVCDHFIVYLSQTFSPEWKKYEEAQYLLITYL